MKKKEKDTSPDLSLGQWPWPSSPPSSPPRLGPGSRPSFPSPHAAQPRASLTLFLGPLTTGARMSAPTPSPTLCYSPVGLGWEQPTPSRNLPIPKTLGFLAISRPIKPQHLPRMLAFRFRFLVVPQLHTPRHLDLTVSETTPPPRQEPPAPLWLEQPSQVSSRRSSPSHRTKLFNFTVAFNYLFSTENLRKYITSTF